MSGFSLAPAFSLGLASAANIGAGGGGGSPNRIVFNGQPVVFNSNPIVYTPPA
jgi:hypothetical protein